MHYMNCSVTREQGCVVKKNVCLNIVAGALFLMVNNGMAKEEGETINILINGASAAQGLYQMLPKIAAADGVKVYTQMLLFDTGSSFKAATKAVLENKKASFGKIVPEVKSKKDKLKYYDQGYLRHANDRHQMIHLGELLKERKWDCVILSINTHQAVNRDVYKTNKSAFDYYAESKMEFTVSFQAKVDFFRQVLPNAKIYIFQNLASRNDSAYKIFKQEKMLRQRGVLRQDEFLTEDKWAILSSLHNTSCARDLEIKPILPGDVLYWARRDKEWGYTEIPPCRESRAYYDTLKPDEPSKWETGRTFRIGYVRRPNKLVEGKRYSSDHHPNHYGNYLTAATAYETVLGRSIVGNTYVPEKGRAKKEEIAILQRIVHETMRDKTK